MGKQRKDDKVISLSFSGFDNDVKFCSLTYSLNFFILQYIVFNLLNLIKNNTIM